MDQLVTSLLITVIDIYTVLLFVRMFAAASERHDAVFGMIFKATDPVVGPLGTALRSRRVDLAPLVVIVVLLLLKGMLLRSVPGALQSFIDRLFQLYVLIMIIISSFREYYINPIASFGQRLVNPVRAVAANFSRQVVTVNLLSILLLVVLHTIVTLLLLNFQTSVMGGMSANPTSVVKDVFVNHSLRLLINLTGFFTLVIIVNALISWVSPDPSNPVVQLLALISAPIIDPIRRIIPPLGGMIDISPIIAIMALQVANAVGHSFLSLL